MSAEESMDNRDRADQEEERASTDSTTAGTSKSLHHTGTAGAAAAVPVSDRVPDSVVDTAERLRKVRPQASDSSQSENVRKRSRQGDNSRDGASTSRGSYSDWWKPPDEVVPHTGYYAWLRQPSMSLDSVKLAKTTGWRETNTREEGQEPREEDQEPGIIHSLPASALEFDETPTMVPQQTQSCQSQDSAHDSISNVCDSDQQQGHEGDDVEIDMSVSDVDADSTHNNTEDHGGSDMSDSEDTGTLDIDLTTAFREYIDADDTEDEEHDGGTADPEKTVQEEEAAQPAPQEPSEEQDSDENGGNNDDAPEESNEDLESSEDEEDQTFANDNDAPIYPNARIGYGTHMLLIMAFIVRHGLSGSAVVDLLTLIEIHCVMGNICETSLRMFNQYFERGSSCERHFFCIICGSYIGKKEGACGKCGNYPSPGSTNYFLISPLDGTFRSFFERADFLDKLSYPFTRSKEDANNIEDVYDGQLYKERFGTDGFFRGTNDSQKGDEVHISLQMNTDGVALFKSSKQSAWPVFFVINELHPKLRYSREFRILAGIWFSKQKPIFSTFMKPFAEILSSLYTKGTKVHLPDGQTKTVRAVLLSACCDSPARCLFQNFTQFNGKHGCPYCLQKGESVKTSERGTTWTYPYVMNSGTGHAERRSQEQTTQHALEAEATGETVFGVKGKVPLFQLPMFDVIRCVPPDYMHGVTIGVFKGLVDLWFDVAHRCSKWSIRSKVKEIDERLMNIKPPNCITRAPQSLATNLKWWKASEFRSFLLFYAVPCLYGILPQIYFEHLLLLVNSLHILLGNSITKQSLAHARMMLKMFVLRIKPLYHPHYYTWNVHSLLHYVDFVEDHGPLFLFSCFWYEDFNGDLRNMFHGTRGVSFQVLTAIAISQKMPILCRSLVYGTVEYDFYNHMMSKSKFKRVQSRDSISQSISVVGVLYPLNKKYRALVDRQIGLTSRLLAFKCLRFCNSIFQSKEYTRLTKRSNYTVKFKFEGSILIGNVVVYVKCYRQCPNNVFCHDNCVCKTELYVAIIESLKPKNIAFHKSVPSVNNYTLEHMRPVECAEHLVIPISDIVSQCILVDVGLREVFVSQLPNSHEKD